MIRSGWTGHGQGYLFGFGPRYGPGNYNRRGDTMRRTVFTALAVGSACALTSTPMSHAATTTVDLSTTGSVVAGITGAQMGQELAFSFTTKNNSTSTATDVSVRFTVTNGSVSQSDYICSLISNHFDIHPDTPACETGSLSAGKSTTNAILVATKATGTMTVKACSTSLNAVTDPVSSNNCKTLAVKIS
jgi:hypothetical protein